MLFTLKPCAGGIGPSWPGAALTLNAWDVYGHMHHDVICTMMSLCLRQGTPAATPTTTVLVGFVQSVQMRYKSWLSWCYTWPRRVRYAVRGRCAFA